ncbi:MAG: molybdenum cofactor biosynthesis protein MoaE [Capsulimonadaceae bacterium]
MLDAGRVIAHVRSPGCGAVVTFHGNTRDSTAGAAVLGLDYSAFRPLAERELLAIAVEAEERWPVRCAVEHRLGLVTPGETSVIIAVASAHRSEAYDACRWLMDSLKARVPIWKKEITEHGARWIEGNEIVPVSPEERI